MMKYLGLSIIFLFLAFSIISGLQADISTKGFALTSPAFKNEESIPAAHACERLGQNRSPKFQWTNPPAQTKSFALVCNDPDAPGGQFIHWILYDIPAQADHLNEGIARIDKLSDGSMQGINSFQRLGYDGPCPPGDSTHRYVFTLYALDRTIDLGGVVTFGILNNAMQEHILGKAELSCRFQGKK